MNAIRRSDNAKRPRRRFTLAGALLAILVGIAGAQTASPVDQVHARTAAHRHHWYEFGLASWYGKFFQGRTTASGEPYNQNAMTCAQRNLPLGSLLRVTNLRNNRSVIVRVNDRGPVPQDRVIDLSRAAAERLGFSQQGVAPVKIELIQAGSERPAEVAELNQAPASR
jgi:rare lipoprotein A